MIDWDNLTKEQIAELCARCRDIDYNWRAAKGQEWCAVRWCREECTYVPGFGPTALAAVIAVTQRVDDVPPMEKP